MEDDIAALVKGEIERMKYREKYHYGCLKHIQRQINDLEHKFSALKAQKPTISYLSRRNHNEYPISPSSK